MDSGPVISEFDDGRIHAHHGPIDLLITVDGPAPCRAKARRSLKMAFSGLLAGLVVDLAILRRPAEHATAATSSTSRRMIAAVSPLARTGFITPMAAVAGSVADTICDAMWDRDMSRLIVNNGGDIAFGLAPGASLTVALADVVSGSVQGGVRIEASDPVRGVASSGRGGRSLSMGIADSVTVLAATAAAADAAATIIASDVDVPGSDRITRCRASDIDANSDLGERLVVVAVDPLRDKDKNRAIARGFETARELRDRGLIAAVAIKLDDFEATLAGSDSDVAALEIGVQERRRWPAVSSVEIVG